MLSRENTIRWGSISKNIIKRITEKQNKLKDLTTIYRKHEYDDLPTMNEIKSSGRLKLTRFDNALKYLITCGVQIGHMQQRLLDAIRITFFPLMFGNELIRNISYLKKKYDLKEIFDMFAGLYPRREGKTVITAIIAAIFMVTQPDGNVICYNIGRRQADNWMIELKKYLGFFKDSPEFGWTELGVLGHERYTIYAKLPGTKNNAYSYPCGITNGTIGCVIFYYYFLHYFSLSH